MKNIIIFLFRAGVIALILLNIYSIHTFNATLTPWYSIFYYPGLLALCSFILLLIILPCTMLSKARTKEEKSAEKGTESTSEDIAEENAQEQAPDHLPIPLMLCMAPFAAFSVSLVLSGFVPFWINTWSIEETERVIVPAQASTEAVVYHEDGTFGGNETSVGTDTSFTYRGFQFSIFEGNYSPGREVRFDLNKGCLGFEFISNPGTY